MSFQVRLVDGEESKSAQQIEQELIAKKEAEDAEREAQILAAQQQQELESQRQQAPEQKKELSEEDVLSFIGNKYGKQLTSIDELFVEPQKEELPVEVDAFMKYKKETGRGLDDYMKLQRDVSAVNEDELLIDYFLSTEIGIDKDDARAMLAEFQYDEDLDDEALVKRAKLSKKKVIGKAKKYFEDLKEQYKVPLEQREQKTSFDDTEEYKQYKQWLDSSKTEQEASKRKGEWFLKKTDEVFSPEFKGFEFEVGEEKIVFSPGDAQELKKNQLTPMNFIAKYLDENGALSDATGYHRSLAIAMNPEKFAKFFYEQGEARAVDKMNKSMKNIDMNQRQAPQYAAKGGMQIREVGNDSGRGLKIKSYPK